VYVNYIGAGESPDRVRAAFSAGKFATLSAINDDGVNIVTIEDPVEYQLAGITQIAVNARSGLTFAAVLPALRQRGVTEAQIDQMLAISETAAHLQLLAAQLMARTGKPAALDHLTVYVIGVFLRLLGVVLFGVAVALDRATFAPWPSALGYLGTILPLLYLETKLGR